MAGRSVKNIYIIGAGGFGREVAWLIERLNETEHKWDLLGFVDDNAKLKGKMVSGYEVLGNCDILSNLDEPFYVVCAIGNPRIKRDIIKKIKKYKNIKFPVLVDKDAIVSDSVKAGEGTIICAGSILTIDITVGEHVAINLDCTVGHDAKIGDYSTLYPSVNVSGNVKIGSDVEIGTGTNIIQGIKIGEGSIVGAGTVVIKDVTDNCTVVGNPARKIEK